MKNGLSLFLVQDSDRPLYLFATDFAHALREWELQMRRENEFAEGEAVPGPDGVQCIAGPDKVLQPAWRPPTDADADAEGCDVDSLRAAIVLRHLEVRERLVIAGALIAAEIDRRDRAAKRRAQGGAS